jgi:hypothetical protein
MLVMLLRLLLMSICFAVTSQALAQQREYSFDIWDWTAPSQDLATFRKWAADLKTIGVTRIELSAPWNQVEPKPGEYDLSFIEKRVAIAKEFGLGTRIRINSFWAGAMPAWSDADTWVDSEGKPAAGMKIPSISDERFWKHYAPMCTAIAKRFHGEDIYYNSFIGMHAELKYGDWWTYDASSLKAWREAIHAIPRPKWLSRVVADAELPDVPPVPKPTHGLPDNSAVSKAFIAFREQTWRDACRRFDEAIHAGDPDARISAPLGESYRRESAAFSNLDYWGMTRGAKQVVHSYDFFWHQKQDPWYAAAAVASFRGITQLPVVFEFDGPALQETFHYTVESEDAIADAAIGQGAGIKVANYSYSQELPSSYQVLRDFGAKLKHAKPQAAEAAPKDTVLLFVSKWANYCYREPKSEWLHDAQFGAWKMLRDGGGHVRFICEDNLAEDLSGYKALYVALSPPELMPQEDQDRLTKLCATLPSIIEVDAIPPLAKENAATARARDLTFATTADGLPIAPANELLQVQGKRVTVGYPLAYVWLHGDRAAQQAVLDWARRQISK